MTLNDIINNLSLSKSKALSKVEYEKKVIETFKGLVKDKIEFDFYEQDIAQIIFMYYNVYHKWYNTLISDIISLSRNEISLYKVYKLISR